MSESASPLEEPDKATQAAASPIKRRLEKLLSSINTPEKAARVAERLRLDSAGIEVESAADQVPIAPAASPEEQAHQAQEGLERAIRAAPDDPVEATAAAIETLAAEAAAMEGPAYEALVEAIQAVTNPALQTEPEKLEAERRYLRDAIMHHPSITFFQKCDTALFIAINNHLHYPRLNRFFQMLSFLFNGGWGWLVAVALFLPFHPRRAIATLKEITPPVWIAALVVEFPVKKYFRRRRPFIDIVRAIVIGKKPGNWSFPSGHAAAAFAGARMMARCMPGGRAAWYGIAALVGFSRIYLGAHYPGDVLSGSLLGVTLSEATRWLVERIRAGRGR